MPSQNPPDLQNSTGGLRRVCLCEQGDLRAPTGFKIRRLVAKKFSRAEWVRKCLWMKSDFLISYTMAFSPESDCSNWWRPWLYLSLVVCFKGDKWMFVVGLKPLGTSNNNVVTWSEGDGDISHSTPSQPSQNPLDSGMGLRVGARCPKPFNSIQAAVKSRI